jgi:hypothetical protein
MFRLTIISLIILTSCRQEPELIWTGGCPPGCVVTPWLTFKFDKAFMFTDSSGKIKEAIKNDSFDEYYKNNKGYLLKTQTIDYINKTLSCDAYSCNPPKPDSTKFNPTNLILFIYEEKVVAEIAVCFSSNIVMSRPKATLYDIGCWEGITRQFDND